MHNYILSIIVPCYNVETYVQECLDSIVELEGKIPFELICINDGSTDATYSIIKSYLNKISNYTIIDQSNQGLATSRNNGLKIAKGKWIYFVDSDDYIDARNLLRLKDILLRSNQDVICTEYFNKRSNQISIIKESIPEIKEINGIEFLKKYYTMSILSMVWRYFYNKDFLINNQFRFIDGIYFEDMVWTPRILLKTKSLSYYKIPINYYRQRDNSIMTSSFSSKKFNDSIYVANKNLEIAINYPDLQKSIIPTVRYTIIKAFCLGQDNYKGSNENEFRILKYNLKRIKDMPLYILVKLYDSIPNAVKIIISILNKIKNL